MSQLEELKLFVAGRLRTATSEILDVIDKTIEAYEQEVTRLKEENKRHSSLLEIILKKKLPKKQGQSIGLILMINEFNRNDGLLCLPV